jgi:murein L,D-transpeptidase YafK
MVVCGKGEGWAVFARQWLAAGVFALLLAGVSRAEALQSWVLVDTRERSLSVWERGRLVEKFDHIAIGRKGTSELKFNGDRKTPVGRYHVTRITRSQRFHLYIGLDYPNLDDARRARDAGVLDERGFEAIRRAV